MSDTNRRSKAYKDAMARVHFLISRKDNMLIATPTADVRVADPQDVDVFEVSRAVGLDIRSLVVRAHINAGALLYDADVGYYNRSGWISFEDAALMQRTVKIIVDGLAQLAERYGETLSFGQHVVRVADILSIRSFLVPVVGSNGGPVTSPPLRAREAIEAIEALARDAAGPVAKLPADVLSSSIN